MKSLEKVVDYWFARENDYQKWFFAGKSLDQRISADFGELLEKVSENKVIPKNDRELLGAIILFDQFSRHIHRGDAKAFSNDESAKRLTLGLIGSEKIDSYSPIERLFILMPLTHSEKISDKKIIMDYLDTKEPGITDERELGIYCQLREHAIKHREVLEKFGRYPKRNQVLGRTSSPEELEYIRTSKNPY